MKVRVSWYDVDRASDSISRTLELPEVPAVGDSVILEWGGNEEVVTVTDRVWRHEDEAEVLVRFDGLDRDAILRALDHAEYADDEALEHVREHVEKVMEIVWHSAPGMLGPNLRTYFEGRP